MRSTRKPSGSAGSGWTQDLRRDLDQIGIEITPVPLGKDRRQLIRSHIQQLLEEKVGFGDELHIHVLDAVVDHLDVMARSVLPDVAGAGRPSLNGLAGLRGLNGPAAGLVHLGRDTVPDRLQVLPGRGLPPRHQRGSEACSQFPSGHSRPEKETATRILALPADGVGPEAVAAIHHQVVALDARLQEL